MSGYYNHAHPTTFECMDGHPEFIAGLASNDNGALFHFIKAECSGGGRIGHCPPYYTNRQLTSVVCSR